MRKSASLLVGNGRVITHDDRRPFFEDGAAAIVDGLIAEVGPTEAMRTAHPGLRFLDARGRVIMPGLINAHTHLYSAFARGITLKDTAPSNFNQILERLWWRLDKALTLDDVYWSAMAGMIDCIRNGVTTIFDHHASPHAVAGSLFRIAEAAEQTRMRACLCYEVSDRDGGKIAEQGIEENRALIEHCNHLPHGRLRGLFGLHASFTLSDESLARCREAAAACDAGFHVHTAEALSDVDHCLREHRMRVVERWNEFGILGEQTLAAHCVHLSNREIDLLCETGTRVVHNPQSNLANAVGCAPVFEMMCRGVRVGLGTDAFTADMFESLKAANLLAKHQSGDPRTGWCEPPQMLFRENAEIASRRFGRQIGKLVPGAVGDLILVDYDPPTPLGAGNLHGHILFGFSGHTVATTIIGGEVVMENRRLCPIDEQAVMADARAAAAELWKRF